MLRYPYKGRCNMIGTRPLTKKEIEALHKYLSRRDSLLLNLGLYTGLRIQESLSLKVGSIMQGRVYVERRAIKGKAAGRSLLLHPALGQQLEAYIADQNLGPQDY